MQVIQIMQPCKSYLQGDLSGLGVSKWAKVWLGVLWCDLMSLSVSSMGYSEKESFKHNLGLPRVITRD